MSKSRAEVNRHLHAESSEGVGITPEYVIAHAIRQKQRGRNPAVAYGGKKNPREAVEAAQAAMIAKYEKEGSVLAWVLDQELPAMAGYATAAGTPENVALRTLTDAPLEVRERFVDELTAEYTQHDDVVPGEDTRAIVIGNIGYIIGYYSKPQRLLAAWQEVEPGLQLPVLATPQ